MVRNFEQNQPVVFEPAEPGRETAPMPEEARALPKATAPSPYGMRAMLFAGVASVFWIGVWCAYLWGYLGSRGLRALEIQQVALFGAAILLPPLLFLAVAGAFGLAHRMSRMAEALQGATENLFVTDDSISRSAARLSRAVRHELDALNAGLDGAYGRLRALETALENQIAAMDEAGARAEVRGEAIAARLSQERQRLEATSENLSEAASRATETLAGRGAQMKSTIEAAEGTLKMAAQSLDVQAAGFRAAAQVAAEAPHAAAVELDNQAKKIESVSDAALQRAEFVLARQEKHRAAMSEMLAKLKDEGEQFEAALTQQRTAMESTVGALSGEAHRFETITGEAERHLEGIMSNAAERASQLTSAFSLEAERLKQTSDEANTVLTSLVSTLRDAGNGAQTLIGESTAQARHDASALVGEAMAECERLLRVAGEMSAEATKIRENLAGAIEDVERHLSRLPTIAQSEAQRIRQMVQSETNEMLDLSARAISTIQSRNAQGRVPPQPPPQSPGTALVLATEGDGLKGLARKITQRPKRNTDLRGNDRVADAKTWEMKTLLAAVENSEPTPPPVRDLGSVSTSALGALQLALADMAVDLEAIGSESAPGNEDWKRYLAGDRAVFARKLANAIDDGAIDRITTLYREDERFHDAADSYLNEFEALLVRSRESDSSGLLTSSILSADTGKIYLAIAYALGRL
jgi:hypothetical protein